MAKIDYVQPWYVYIAECRDKTLYVGVAIDPVKRVEEHNRTNRCRYTRFRKPLISIYKERCENYHVARKREWQIKKFSRKKKLELVNSK